MPSYSDGSLNFSNESVFSRFLEQRQRMIDPPESVATHLLEIVERLRRAEAAEEELKFIQATLMVNCKPERVLYNLGLCYDSTRPVHSNLVVILEIVTQRLLLAEAKLKELQVE